MRQMNIILLALTLFIGCAAPNPGSGSTEQRSSSDMPQWFLMVPTAEDAFYGVGMAKKQNPSLAKKAATARARTEISSAVNTKVQSMIKDFMQESGVGETAQALEFTEQVTKQVTDNSLQGSNIKEAYVAKDGTIYILVEYSLNQVKENALSAAKSANREEALYNEFKASQAFEELNSSLD